MIDAVVCAVWLQVCGELQLAALRQSEDHQPRSEQWRGAAAARHAAAGDAGRSTAQWLGARGVAQSVAAGCRPRVRSGLRACWGRKELMCFGGVGTRIEAVGPQAIAPGYNFVRLFCPSVSMRGRCRSRCVHVQWGPVLTGKGVPGGRVDHDRSNVAAGIVFVVKGLLRTAGTLQSVPALHHCKSDALRVASGGAPFSSLWRTCFESERVVSDSTHALSLLLLLPIQP